MTKRMCFMLALLTIFLATHAGAQGPTASAQRAQQSVLDCSNRVLGSLDSNAIRMETRFLKPLVSDTILKNLSQIMLKNFPGQSAGGQTASGSAMADFYIDPASTEREEGQGQAVIRVGAKTKIQIFGERKDIIEKTDVCYKQSDNGVLTVRTAMPQDKARSMEDILASDKVTFDRCVTDLGRLEIVGVPMISRPDKDNPCKCEEGKACALRMSTLILVPSRVFEEKKGQASGASTASFAAYPSDLRQEKQRLEREAATLIEWLRNNQRENQMCCFTEDEVLLLAEDIPDALKRWGAFWSSVAGRIQQIKVEEDASRKNLPPAPSAPASETKTLPAAAKVKKSGQ